MAIILSDLVSAIIQPVVSDLIPSAGTPEGTSEYFRPDGTSQYLRPDGVSLYKRPFGL